MVIIGGMADGGTYLALFAIDGFLIDIMHKTFTDYL
jgi:hypothetical protein